MPSALRCWATTGSPVCSQASRADRCESADGPATTRAPGASRSYRSSSARWQTTAKSAPATSRAPIRPSTYRPSAPRSAGTSVASISTRGATTALAPFLGHPGCATRAAGSAKHACHGCPVGNKAYALCKTGTSTYPITPAVAWAGRRARTSTVFRAEASAGGDGLAGLDVLQVRDGLAERADLDHLQAGRDRALDVRAVGRGGQEDRRARVTGAHHLLLDAADGVYLAADLDLAGPGDELAAGQVHRGQLVDDAEREHHARAGPADVAHAELHRERELELPADLDAHHPMPAGLLGPDPDRLAPAVARDSQGQRGPRRVRADQGGQARLAGRRVSGHRRTVHAGDHVAGLEHARGGEARLRLAPR